jgi:hypothetical protein
MNNESKKTAGILKNAKIIQSKNAKNIFENLLTCGTGLSF